MRASVAGIVFANAYDESLSRLTQKRSIASVPFGGRYRLIDFSLSNLVNAGVTNVGVITKEKYRSLMDHIGSGGYWDLDRKNGGVRILPPFDIGGSRRYRGYVEALNGAMDFMHRCNAEHIVLCDARTVANVDLESVIRGHINSDADITVVYGRGDERKNLDDTMVLSLDAANRITAVEFPQIIPEGEIRSIGIFVFRRDVLIELTKASYENGGESICKDVIAQEIGALKIFACPHAGFTAIMDSPASYKKASMQLLESNVRRELFNRDRPIYTKTRDDMPTRYGTKSVVKNSFIAEGCVIEGSVKNSILFRGVKVEKGAIVENSILMQGVSVGKDTALDRVISDKNATIGEGMTIKGTEEKAFLIEKNQTL